MVSNGMRAIVRTGYFPNCDEALEVTFVPLQPASRSNANGTNSTRTDQSLTSKPRSS